MGNIRRSGRLGSTCLSVNMKWPSARAAPCGGTPCSCSRGEAAVCVLWSQRSFVTRRTRWGRVCGPRTGQRPVGARQMVSPDGRGVLSACPRRGHDKAQIGSSGGRARQPWRSFGRGPCTPAFQGPLSRASCLSTALSPAPAPGTPPAAGGASPRHCRQQRPSVA